MKKWLTHEFSSGGYAGDDFKSFARAFKTALKKQVEGKNIDIASYSVGHYYVSGFLQRGDEYIYFSIPDVRYFNNEWNNNILFRTAKSLRDYTGGSNNFTSLKDFGSSVERLFNFMSRKASKA